MKRFEFNYKFMIRESCHLPLVSWSLKKSMICKIINKKINCVKKKCITLSALSVNLSYISIH